MSPHHDPDAAEAGRDVEQEGGYLTISPELTEDDLSEGNSDSAPQTNPRLRHPATTTTTTTISNNDTANQEQPLLLSTSNVEVEEFAERVESSQHENTSFGNGAEPPPLREHCFGPFKWGSQPHHVMPYPPSTYWKDRRQIFHEVLAGITTSFAQVPGSIAFAAIAGVDPLLGLHPAWIVGFFTAAFGSRPGMINGATGVRAATVAPFVAKYGVGMLFWIVLMISIYQTIFALLSLPKLIRLVPRPAMIGFTNGLAIIIFLGQLFAFKHDCGIGTSSLDIPCPPGVDDGDYRTGTTLHLMIAQVFITLFGCIIGLKFIKGVPPSMVGIVLSVVVEWAILRQVGYSTPIIGEVSRVEGGLPKFFWADSTYSSSDIPPLNWETVKLVLWPAFIAAAAGAVEAVMTMEVINDITESSNPAPNQQLYALSLGNFVSGLFGTMGGGATIGESILNCINGANGRYRISGIVASLMMFIYIIAASSAIEKIPTASLVGVMFLIAFTAFEWESPLMIVAAFLPQKWRHAKYLRKYTIRKISRVDALCIIVVVAVTLLTDLFTGVAAGIALTSIAYCWQVGFHISATTSLVRDKHNVVVKKRYRINGPLFFASAMRFPQIFTPKADPDIVEVLFDHDTADVYDFSALHALNVVGEKYKKLDKQLVVKKLSHKSAKIISKAHQLVRHFVVRQEEVTDEEQEVALSEPFHAGVLRQAYPHHGSISSTSANAAIAEDGRIHTEAVPAAPIVVVNGTERQTASSDSDDNAAEPLALSISVV